MLKDTKTIFGGVTLDDKQRQDKLKDLIRNLSKKKSADAQILMRNYMMERFLERISLSEYKISYIKRWDAGGGNGWSGCQSYYGSGCYHKRH